jgi:hypothetical protein
MTATVPSKSEALVRWQHAAGPYWPYVCAAPFLGADAVARPGPERRARGWTRRQRALADDLTGGPLVLLELPPEPILDAAPLLVERGWYVVPVIQRWIASPAVLPCGRLMRALVDGARRARRPVSPRGAVLVADGVRAGPPGYPASVTGRTFDNRYEYQICRFPSLDFLAAQGVGHVRWVTARRDGAVGPDLAPYLEDLLRAGIEVEVQPWPSRWPGA